MAQAKGNVEVILQGRGSLTLHPADYLASGGEAAVYRAAGTVIKLYTDPGKMQRDGMVDKVKLLLTLAHPFISAPQGVVTDIKNVPLGFYMPYVDGEPLSRVFTGDFRNREGFTDTHATTLVAHMQEVVRHAHSKKALLVDANELNWLVVRPSKDDPQPRVIDVDSWAIGRWPATVIMPSIRDMQTQGFNQLTDWFSWGIVTFQVFTGIHPYKGKLDPFKPGDLEARMKAQKSVFTPGIRLNHAVRDFSCIAGPLCDWYKATFQNGQRSIPPSPFDKGIAKVSPAQVTRAVVTTTGVLVFDKLFDGGSDHIMRIWPCGVVLFASGKLVDLTTKRVIGTLSSTSGEIVRVEGGWPAGAGWLVSEYIAGQAQFTFINGTNYQTESIPFALNSRHLVRYENRLFLVTEQGLTEVISHRIGNKTLLTVGQTWGLMSNATRWFDGVGVQDAMGSIFLVTPFNDTACAITRTPELDGLRTVVAKAGDRFVSLIALDKAGNYRKLEFSFSQNYASYTLWQGGADSSDLNMAILPKGVCATIIDDGELDIFVPRNGAVNRIKDKNITADMILGNWDNTVVYAHKGSVWSIRIK